MGDQLSLPFERKSERSIDTFIVGQNKILIDRLLTEKKEFCQTFIYAPKGSGKTHLINAIHAKKCVANTSIIVSLRDMKEFGPDVLDQLEFMDYVFIDDIDEIFGNREWELAFYRLINESMNKNSNHLVFTSSINIINDKSVLKDLKTRIQWGSIFELIPLNDDELRELVYTMVKSKGLIIENHIITFLYNHTKWDISTLSKNINFICEQSIVNKHPITIPFIKKILNLVN